MTITPPTYFVPKHSAATNSYTLDFSTEVGSATIASAIIGIQPSGNLVCVGTPTWESNVVSFVLGGGVEGQTYEILCTVITSNPSLILVQSAQIAILVDAVVGPTAPSYSGNGVTGPTGPSGSQGVQGPTGANGSFNTSTLPAIVAQSQSLITRPGIRVMAFGDSEDNFNAQNTLGGSGLGAGNQYIVYSNSGILSSANKYLGGALNFDLTQGYGPVYYLTGAMKIIVTNGGNYSVPPTGATLTGATLGTPVMSGNGVVSVPILAGTASIATGTAVTFTGGTGTAATAYCLSGSGGTFGSPGATTSQMVNYVSDCAACSADIIVMHGGVNDYGSSIPVATTKSNLVTIWQTLMQAGKTVIYCSLLPRNTTGVSAQMLQLAQLNHWARQWIAGQSSLRPTGYGSIMLLDREPECLDQSSSTGNFLATMSADGLHEGLLAPATLGYKLAQMLRPLLGIQGNYLASTSPADTYDATYNPGGALGSTFYTMTGGNVYSPCTGTVPAGWALQRFSGSATGTICVGSTETTRSDGLSGSRFLVTQSIGGGSNYEQFDLNNQSPSVASLGITAGTDYIYGEVAIEISNVAKVSNIFLQLTLNGTSTQGQSVDQFTPIPSTALYGASTSQQLVMRTPPIKTTAGTTSVFLELQWIMDGSGAANSATMTMKVSNFSLRKFV